MHFHFDTVNQYHTHLYRIWSISLKESKSETDYIVIEYTNMFSFVCFKVFMNGCTPSAYSKVISQISN